MPNKNTFQIKPIQEFVERWLTGCELVVDPFAGISTYGTIRNDLNPAFDTHFHMKADEFCQLLQGIEADAVIFDPPYSPRQIAEVYKGIGRVVTTEDTQSSFYRLVREPLVKLLKPGGIALSFGWNSSGLGKSLETEEILLVSHGGAHNDTICVAQRK